MFVNLNMTAVRDSVNHGHCDAEQYAENHDLEYLPLGNGFGNIFGEYMQNDVVPALALNLGQAPLGHGSRYNYSMAGPADIDCKQPDEQCDGRYDFEIQQGLPSHPSDLFEIGMPGYARDQSPEKKRGNNGLDKMYEDLAHQVHLFCNNRKIIAKFNTGKH